jgi:hypothetical protein
MAKRSKNHIVMVIDECCEPIFSEHQTFWCKACGSRESIACPAGLDFISACMKVFLKIHSRCRMGNLPKVDEKMYKGDWTKHLGP